MEMGADFVPLLSKQCKAGLAVTVADLHGEQLRKQEVVAHKDANSAALKQHRAEENLHVRSMKEDLQAQLNLSKAQLKQLTSQISQLQLSVRYCVCQAPKSTHRLCACAISL